MKKELLEQSEDIIRLIPKQRKGILRLLFSRIGIMVLLILMQLGLLIFMVYSFNGYSYIFSTLRIIFTVIMVLYLFNCGMDSSAKLTWLILIVVFPLMGTVFLWYTQMNFGNRDLRKMVAASVKETKQKLTQKQSVLTDPVIVESGTDDLYKYLNRSGCFPLYENTEVKFFPLGE